MKRSISIILCGIIVISSVFGLSTGAYAREADIVQTGMGTDYHLYQSKEDISATNDLADSQTVTFKRGSYTYSSTDIYNLLYYGYIVASSSETSGLSPYKESGLTLDAIKAKNKWEGTFDSSLGTFSVIISDPGVYYGLYLHERLESTGFGYYSFDYKDHHFNYWITEYPVYAYKTTLDPNGGEAAYSYLITVNTPYKETTQISPYYWQTNIVYTENECSFPVPTREGYTCIGWSEDKNDTSGVWSVMPEDNRTYYAIWSKNVILGDVDGNGEADTADATHVQRKATMLTVPFSDADMKAGDVDGSGELTVVDATFIQRYATHVKVPYPIGEEKSV